MARGYRRLDEIVSGSVIGVEPIAAPKMQHASGQYDDFARVPHRIWSKQRSSGRIAGNRQHALSLPSRSELGILAAKQPRRNFPKRILPEQAQAHVSQRGAEGKAAYRAGTDSGRDP
jgi:hypothetical protein